MSKKWDGFSSFYSWSLFEKIDGIWYLSKKKFDYYAINEDYRCDGCWIFKTTVFEPYDFDEHMCWDCLKKYYSKRGTPILENS